MDLTATQYNQLMAFFEGRMSDEEMETFLAEVNTDPDLKEQFDFEQVLFINKLMLEREKAETLEAVPLPVQATPGRSPVASYKIRFPVHRLWLAFAVAAMLLAAVFVIVNAGKKIQPPIIGKESPREPDFQPARDSSNKAPLLPTGKSSVNFEKIFLTHYRKYPSHDRGYPELGIAMAAYNKSNYNAALAALAHVPVRMGEQHSNNGRDGIVKFYTGLCYLEKKQTAMAEKTLYDASAKYNQPLGLIQDIQWYYGLALVRNQQPDAAIEVLRQLTNSASYGKQTDIIIKELQ